VPAVRGGKASPRPLPGCPRADVSDRRRLRRLFHLGRGVTGRSFPLASLNSRACRARVRASYNALETYHFPSSCFISTEEVFSADWRVVTPAAEVTGAPKFGSAGTRSK